MIVTFSKAWVSHQAENGPAKNHMRGAVLQVGRTPLATRDSAGAMESRPTFLEPLGTWCEQLTPAGRPQLEHGATPTLASLTANMHQGQSGAAGRRDGAAQQARVTAALPRPTAHAHACNPRPPTRRPLHARRPAGLASLPPAPPGRSARRLAVAAASPARCAGARTARSKHAARLQAQDRSARPPLPQGTACPVGLASLTDWSPAAGWPALLGHPSMKRCIGLLPLNVTDSLDWNAQVTN